MPPNIQDVKVYFAQKGIPEPEAEIFFLLQEKRQWLLARGDPYRNGSAPRDDGF